MEKVAELFEAMNLKAQKLQDAMTVIPHRAELTEKLNELSKSSKEAKELEADIKKLMDEQQDHLKKEYANTKKSMNRVQMKMMYLLQHLDKKDNVQDVQATSSLPQTRKMVGALNFDSVSSLSVDSLTSSSEACTLAKMSPRPSPRQGKASKVPVFKADITEEGFKKVPSYMKGRSTLVELQSFLEKVIVRTFYEKYLTLQKKSSDLSCADLKLYNLFKEQARLFDGEKFITVDDILRVTGSKIDKKEGRFIQIARHLHIIRESRKGPVCCYVWVHPYL